MSIDNIVAGLVSVGGFGTALYGGIISHTASFNPEYAQSASKMVTYGLVVGGVGAAYLLIKCLIKYGGGSGGDGGSFFGGCGGGGCGGGGCGGGGCGGGGCGGG